MLDSGICSTPVINTKYAELLIDTDCLYSRSKTKVEKKRGLFVCRQTTVFLCLILP